MLNDNKWLNRKNKWPFQLFKKYGHIYIIYIYMCVCVCVCVCVYLRICPPTPLSLYLSPPPPLSLYIYTQLYISTRPDETSKLSKITECVKNIKDWMTNHFLILNSNKTVILLIGSKNSTEYLLDHTLKLDGCTITSSTVKNSFWCYIRQQLIFRKSYFPCYKNSILPS